jgi:uncharacterized protein YdeI (YjbR/CyaY-like superfamily)
MSNILADRVECVNAMCDKLIDNWLIYYKKRSGKLSITYSDAVDETLCFGWIDSKIKSIDTLAQASVHLYPLSSTKHCF